MILFLVIVPFIVLLLLALLFYRTNFYQNSILPIQGYSKMPDGIDMINLGSTYSMYSFNAYKELNLNGFNFALPHHSLEMDNVVFNNYSSKLSPGCIVAIVVSACTCFYRNDQNSDSSLYYYILKRSQIPYSSIFKQISSHAPFIVRPKELFRFLKDKSLAKDITDYWDLPCPREKEDLLMKQLSDCWIKMFGLKNLKSTDVGDSLMSTVDFNLDQIDKIIHYCILNGFRPVLVIPPISQKLYHYFSEEFYSFFWGKKLRRFQHSYDIRIFDYHNHPIFNNNTSLFCDGGFRLNKQGSIIFMRSFLSDLTKNGIWATNKTISNDEYYQNDKEKVE